MNTQETQYINDLVGVQNEFCINVLNRKYKIKLINNPKGECKKPYEIHFSLPNSSVGMLCGSYEGLFHKLFPLLQYENKLKRNVLLAFKTMSKNMFSEIQNGEYSIKVPNEISDGSKEKWTYKLEDSDSLYLYKPKNNNEWLQLIYDLIKGYGIKPEDSSLSIRYYYKDEPKEVTQAVANFGRSLFQSYLRNKFDILKGGWYLSLVDTANMATIKKFGVDLYANGLQLIDKPVDVTTIAPDESNYYLIYAEKLIETVGEDEILEKHDCKELEDLKMGLSLYVYILDNIRFLAVDPENDRIELDKLKRLFEHPNAPLPDWIEYK